VIARVIARRSDGRDLQIQIGGNPHTDAGWKKSEDCVNATLDVFAGACTMSA
jgi:hypothetical protein